MSPVSSVFHTEGNSDCWSQELTQSGNIHSKILDVYDGRQSPQNYISVQIASSVWLKISLYLIAKIKDIKSILLDWKRLLLDWRQAV